jgi:hypothetical protein
MWRSAGFAGEITIAPYSSDKVWLALTWRRDNRSKANAHPRNPPRHEPVDLGGLRHHGAQPYPTPHGGGWPAFEHRPHVRGPRWCSLGYTQAACCQISEISGSEAAHNAGDGSQMVPFFAAAPHPNILGPPHTASAPPDRLRGALGPLTSGFDGEGDPVRGW